MTVDKEALRDWHRLFGMLLTDLFTNSPFIVEVERDLSQQQQLLDVVVVRKGRGRFVGRLPDGLEELTTHNLISFKSRHEALTAWAMKELVSHSVAYRKLVSPSPSELLPEDQFRLFAVCARYPHNLAGQVPWRQVQAGVYDCQWGTDTIRVVVAGELSREPHNAPLHLFSASPDLVGFGSGIYRRRSENTSAMLVQLFEKVQGEGFAMYTIEDFQRQYAKDHFPRLTPEEQAEVLHSLPVEVRGHILQSLPPKEQEEVLQSLPLEKRLAGLSEEQIRQHLDRLTVDRPAAARKPRRRK